MNIKHSLLIAVTSLSALTAANAQEKVEVKVTGRALFDAATYSQNEAAKTQDGTMPAGRISSQPSSRGSSTTSRSAASTTGRT